MTSNYRPTNLNQSSILDSLVEECDQYFLAATSKSGYDIIIKAFFNMVRPNMHLSYFTIFDF